MINLTPKQHGWRSWFSWSTRKGRRVLTTLLVLGVLTLWLGTASFFTLKNTREAKAQFTQAQDLLITQDFPGARAKLAEAQVSLERTRRSVNAYWPLTVLPPTSTQFGFIGDTLDSVHAVAGALDQVVAVTEGIVTPVLGDDDLSLSKLTVDQKRQMLKGIYEAGPALTSARDEIHGTISLLTPERVDKLWGPVRRAVSPLVDRLTVLDQTMATVVPATQIIPALAGYPESKTYLFLLQNNTELRPSGGFIGTYGELQIGNGDINAFHTDNVYNLDNAVKFTMNTVPPEPMKKYLGADRWFFRDSNWSPDFPTSARKALEFYQLEGGRAKFDGVIAVDPTFIQSLLRLTGNITVDGTTFTPDNFVSTLEHLVEFGYLKQGIPESERKEVIGDLSKILMTRLLSLPQTKFKDLWTILSQDINERHILLYSKDEAVQSVLEDIRWAGALEPLKGDGLALVDANLASLKTDRAIQRAINYTVKQENGKLIATTTITYHHREDFSLIVTRYRTYLRLYVPLGSKLISSQGADLRDRSDAPGNVETFEELGRTVFGAFKSVEPKTSESISFTYELPANVMKDNAYHFFLQKQSGIPSLAITLNLDLPKRLTQLSHLDTLKKTGDTTVTFDKVMRTDVAFTATLQP
jgi:hypothetical protein